MMKKTEYGRRFAAGALALLMLAGCGDAAPNDSEAKTQTTDQQMMSADRSAEERETASSAQDALVAGTEQTAAGGAQDETEAQEAPVSDAGDAAAAEAVYEDFRKGGVGALYRGTADTASYLCLSSVLQPGNIYTCTEISEQLGRFDGEAVYVPQGEPEYTGIDCGSDGVPELLMTQEYVMDGGYSEVFTLFMVLKEIDGQPVICFDGDQWSRSYLEVRDNGVIESGGSGGANVHIGEFAYLDAAGDYHYYYGCQSTVIPYGEYYAYKHGYEDYEVIPMEGLDVDHLALDEYWFTEQDEERDYWHVAYRTDDMGNAVSEDADQGDLPLVRQRFQAAGIKLMTESEASARLAERAREIGFPGE